MDQNCLKTGQTRQSKSDQFHQSWREISSGPLTHLSVARAVRQHSLPLPLPEHSNSNVKKILKESSQSWKTLSRNSSKSTKTIRFQRQDSFDCDSLQTTGSVPGCAEDKDPSAQVTKRKFRAQLMREQSSFTGEEIQSLQAAFSKLDQDGNGCLSHDEVTTALGDMIAEEDIESLLEEMDADGDGEINYQVSWN